MKTRVYIDGFNLYYGRLKGTPYKWLDTLKLFENQILPSVLCDEWHSTPYLCPDQAISYFSAKIVERLSSASDSVSCQAKYHTALKKHYHGRIKLFEGYYSVSQQRVKAVDQEDENTLPKDCEHVLIWKVEEKQSDVNLALQAYHDAITNQVEQVVIVTNDTDIAPAMSMIREHTDIVLGLVIPSDSESRRPNTALTEQAHWTVSAINENQLKASQLPRVIPGRKATTKPISWYAQPILLQKAIDLAIPICGNRSKVFKWMDTPNPYLNNDIPIELMETTAGAERVLTYMRNWISSNE